ncbi:sporulation integral membrane protein YtvI [Bacillus songklensis]|uniref:Sporulation integral membrane protein YtvI n=1 Tax=Bacillus songklensis TaxID=1069116 RepID=A0ABV8B714_9BACI
MWFQKYKKWIFLVVVLALLAWFLPYSMPLVLGLFTALLLDGAVRFFEGRFSLKRIYAVTITFCLFLAGIGLLFYFVIVMLIDQIVIFSKRVPEWVRNFNVEPIKEYIFQWQKVSDNLPPEIVTSIESSIDSSKQALIQFASNVAESTINLLATVPTFMIELIIYFIALFLFSLELPSLKRKVTSFLTDKTKSKVELIMRQLSRAGVGFLKAQFLLSFITFIISFVGLSILGVKYVAIISLIIVLVDLLPILGTGSALVPWAIFLIMSGDSKTGIGLIILFVVITVVRRVIEPKVFSQSLGISPLASLISIYLGFKMLGFIGLLVGPALVIVIETIIRANILKLNFKI